MKRFALLGVLLALASTTTGAHADVVERVVATVNDEAIFLSDLRRRAIPFLPQLAAAESEAQRVAGLQQLYDQLLELLVDEELIHQLARTSQLTVTSEELNQAMVNQRNHFKMDEDQFWQAVKEQGMSRQEYEKTVRKQLVRFKVMNERVRSRVNITEAQVRRKYESQAREQGTRLRFRVSHITLDIGGVGAATDVAKTRKEANALRTTLTADNFEENIAKHGGGELGWLKQGDLPAELEEALLTLQPGQVSTPVRAAGLFHIFLLHERDTGDDLASFEETKEQLFRQMLDAQMQRQEQIFLGELRRKAAVRRLL